MSTPPAASTANRRRDAVRWLTGRINYERSAPIPYSDEGMKLDRMRDLLRRLGDPHAGLEIVHIAGTKGKGSTGAIVAEALRRAGRRVGVYSSPHLERIEERFAIDGDPCPAGELVELVDAVRAAAEAMDGEGGGPTYFDLTTAIALLRFAGARCDAVVLEVGLGGRLDSTNVVTPRVAVVTSISLDHTRQLGETVGEIAVEKAGIFKPGVPAVIGAGAGEAGDALQRIADERGCPARRRGRDFDLRREGDSWRFTRRVGECSLSVDGVRPALPGAAHADNAATALETLAVLADAGWGIPVGARRGAVAESRLPARMERVAGRPLVVVDGAHNDASAEALAEAIDALCGGVARERRVLVLAIGRDKDARAIVAPLAPRFGAVVATRFVENPRARPPAEIAALCAGLCDRVIPAEEPLAALGEARRLAGPDGAVVIAGSLFLAAELRPAALAARAE